MLYVFHYLPKIQAKTLMTTCCNRARVKFHAIAANFKENIATPITPTYSLLISPLNSARSDISVQAQPHQFEQCLAYIVV